MKKDNVADVVTSQVYQTVCQYAIRMMEVRLRMIQEDMENEYDRNVVSSITSRIKTPGSIERKLKKKKLKPNFSNAKEKLNDLVGLRVTCFFEDDIYEIVKRLEKQRDISIVKSKDYIKKPKANGYKSYHLIIDIPVYGVAKNDTLRVEVQLRTVAMDFWAQLDYQLCYKKESHGTKNKEISKKLADCAEQIAKMDKEMLKLRKEIEVL